MTAAELENAELKLAQLKAKNTEVRQAIAKLCAIQESTDEVISSLNLQIINARIEFERK